MTKSIQNTSFTKFKTPIFVCSENDRDRCVLFLEREKELDAQNYKEMLDTVDLTTMTKAKITALGKLGKQYNKASDALIKKYKIAKVNTTLGKEKKWII